MDVTPIQKAINALMTRAPNVDRPPISMGTSSGLSGALTGSTVSATQNMNAMSATGWLFAVVERIATSMASIEWKLYSKRGDQLQEIDNHPLLKLWREPNPFYSQSEFIEDSSNHFELAGEMAWIMVRGTGNAIVELWPVRPDRIKPIPDANNYINGYVYQIANSDPVPLDSDDVIFMRRPHPTIPYRGIGQVQAILHDIESEQMASAWQRNFFSNSALPSGIIEFDHNLSQQDFQRLVERWREQHQGVSNSHRVAILERGKWTDRKYTQRDMEFKETRMLNRDIILGSFGFPHALLGISENVNLANANAAESMFARWLIRPRLIRIRDKVNQTLVRQFDPNLYLDFVDPVPEDRDQELNSGERGFNAGILTQNEARRRLGEGAVEGGDTFKVETDPQPDPLTNAGIIGNSQKTTLSDQRDDDFINELDVPPAEKQNETEGLEAGPQKRDNDPLLPSLIERAELEMQKGWTRRLRHEMLSIISDLTLNVRGSSDSVQKLEMTDLEHHNWDWEERYGDDVRAELTEVFDASLRESGYLQPAEVEEAGVQADQQKLEFTEPITYSIAYARHRAAELLTLGGELSLVNTVRLRVRYLVTDTIRRRESVQYLARALRSDHAFSPAKAQTISRTETATAYGQGTRRAALSQGRDEKRWTTQGDDAVDGGIGGPCIDNESQGWIKLSEPFMSGHDTTPSHPNCRCVVRYRTSELHVEAAAKPTPAPKTIDEARCDHCNKLLQKKFHGGTLFCHRCKQETTFEI